MTEPSGSAGEWADANGANRRSPESISRFVEHFAAQMVEAGMPRMPSRVFAALLASDAGALTSAELGEQLRISPAAVSGAVRYLAQVHMVSREREPGSRRERYRVRGDQWYEALTNREAVLKRWEDALRDGVDSLGPDTPAGRRLAETLAFFEYLEGELAALMERWHAHRERLFGRD
ncbi:GbsR/MarR family transcriptional regulator [Streptomyces chromofuscus]|uniref:MarR family transcriptional regulator n=1 Tax=Streptomyces chromofuscus TaxID=42881 RepID=A0A7M2T0I5_STRCW|nr:MarR family transcriptional regulator [Streptomyces chromofuscus]QOV42072.1 MarR family transcriptional regulator [Streptomyces chromofuscus]GGS85815.1 MarR family transcriptional regulator [Streptomyces chromofuscus]